MFTLNRLLAAFQDANRLQFEGTHYSDACPVWSGDLWRLFGNAIGDAPENKTASRKLRRLESLCETAGIQLRFYDEITTDDNGRVHETQPGFYGATLTYALLNDCEIWAQDEAAEHLDDYAERCIYEPGAFNNHMDSWDIDFTSIGFVKWSPDAAEPEIYETGFHAGQNDSPETVAAAIAAKYGDAVEIIFARDHAGQFDVHWFAWLRTPEMKEAALDAYLSQPSPAAPAVEPVEPAATLPDLRNDITRNMHSGLGDSLLRMVADIKAERSGAGR